MAFAFIIFYLTFLSPLTSLIDFFYLLTICLSLTTGVLSSLDQIPSSSLNLKCISLSLHLKSNQKSSFFSLYRAAELWTRSWLVETIDGSVGLGFLEGCWMSFGFGWWSWLCRLLISILPLSNSAQSRLPLSRRLGLSDLTHHHLAV